MTGSDVGKPHATEFYLYFPDEPSVEAAESQLASEEYEVHVEESDEDGGCRRCLANCSMVPSESEIARASDDESRG